MDRRLVLAARGKAPFDLLIDHVRIVNILTEEISNGCVGIVGDTIAYAGEKLPAFGALETLEGDGACVLPGLIDGHMHIESTMLLPAAFAEAVVPLGTTACAADPHEIANVLGPAGVALMCEQCRGLPLRVYMMAPSTVPSAPSLETPGAEIGARDAAEMLRYDGVLGLGEVMDFNGVINADEKMLSIIEQAKNAGVIVDGHVPTLTGADLQAFAAAGIGSDHTYMERDTLLEKLSLGLYVEVQERFLTPSLVDCMNKLKAQSRVMLVTDDVPLTRLMTRGHLNAVLNKAMALGLEPMKAYRYATLNAADRLGLHSVGLVAPGHKADLMLLDDWTDASPRVVLCGGKIAARDGEYLPQGKSTEIPAFALNTMHQKPLNAGALDVMARGASVRVNAVRQDGKTSRTTLEEVTLPVKNGRVGFGPLAKMAVFDRHRENGGHSVGFISNMEGFHGAIATTYAHDCHNLTVYGTDDGDMLLAANAVINAGGGLAVAVGGALLSVLPLPVAGLMGLKGAKEMGALMADFENAVQKTGLPHDEPLTFITLMALAVSPFVKLTDRGLVDTANKRFLPVVIGEAEA